MRFINILSIMLFTGMFALNGQKPAAPLGEVETTWPGIHFQVARIMRIPGDRLLVLVRVVATGAAPKGGTMIGIPVPVPANATQAEIDQGLYNPIPFSLDSSVMVDEATKTSYPTLKANPSENYMSGVLLCSLRPNQAEAMAVQFKAPPLRLDSRGKPAQQTVSITLTNAKEPISNIPLPMPARDAASVKQ